MELEQIEHLHALLDQEDHATARQLIEQGLVHIQGIEPTKRLYKEAELYGFLCDLGTESGNEGDLVRSIAFMEVNGPALEPLVARSSYYYNLANAKSSLAKIRMRNRPGVRTPYDTEDTLHEAISLYWRAYSEANGDDLQDQIAINLSNALTCAGRYVEAIQFLDLVLRKAPGFQQALVSRADALRMLPIISNGGLSASLIAQIYHGYGSAIKAGTLPPSRRQYCEARMAEALKDLAIYGFGLPDLEKEINETQAEYKALSGQRRFAIDHFLTLNEHAVHCPCNAAKWDDLQIGSSHLHLAGKVVPRLELLLNRIKSEYALARWMYFTSSTGVEEIALDVRFSELFEGESLEPATELLRTSYRQCYGILDKLAEGVCQLYDVQTKNVYFERFWDRKEVKERLSQVKNFHLNALHSIASDLNFEKGELREFKKWRNKMEHGLFVLVDRERPRMDPLGLLDDGTLVCVDLEEFKRKTLHLLQLTRAAIMSFTYCVRLQTLSAEQPKGRPITIDFRKR